MGSTDDPSVLARRSTRKPARKLEPGDVLADGLVVERVELSEGARSVYVEGGDPRIPRRFWPRQKVEVRNG